MICLFVFLFQYLLCNVDGFLHFNNNKFIEQLSSDYFYTHAQVKPLFEPTLIMLNEDLLKEFTNLTIDRSQFAEFLSGNRLFSGSKPVAMNYAGHQFGIFVPALGDGRALLLGQINYSAFHIKGSGPTVYSRGGDGRAVLRSSIREFLASEAMFHLGIETTRALSLVGSIFEPVRRETIETAAVVVRVAPILSFIRFGTFEYFSSRNQCDQVRQLADFVIEHLDLKTGINENRYENLLMEISRRTGKLVAQWQSFGFAHGVLNTDNMNVLGSTLDYGPFSFVEDQIEGFVPNHSDDEGRYAFDRQPSIAAWNLNKLGVAFRCLIGRKSSFDVEKQFWTSFKFFYDDLMRQKLGFFFYRQSDRWFYEEIIRLLHFHRIDFTQFWRNLSRNEFPREIRNDQWSKLYLERIQSEGSYAQRIRSQRMEQINPKFILRNYLAQIAIEKAQRNDFNEIERLFDLLKRPFDEQNDLEFYAKLSPAWAKNLIISCSS